jgi:hypothetical protein
MNNNNNNELEKIKNFQIMTDTNDEQIAIDFLVKYNWDESV